MGRTAEEAGGDTAGKGSTFGRIYGHNETGQLRPYLGALLVSLLTLSFQKYLQFQP